MEKFIKIIRKIIGVIFICGAGLVSFVLTYSIIGDLKYNIKPTLRDILIPTTICSRFGKTKSEQNI